MQTQLLRALTYAGLTALAAAQSDQFAELPGSILPQPRAPATTKMFTFDADGDGKKDIIYFDSPGIGTPVIRFMLGDGYGGFRESTSGRIPAELSYYGTAAVGDMDGDGDIDLVKVGAQDPRRRIFLLRNDGNGRYAPESFALPNDGHGTGGVALADVDGDKDLDAVLARGGGRRAPGPMLLLLNDGRGKLTLAAPGSMPSTVSLGGTLVLFDADGDGDVDIVRDGPDRARLSRGDGRGRFVDAGALPPHAHMWDSADVADVDGDGDQDLLATTWRGSAMLLINNGRGSFIDQTSWLPGKPGGRAEVMLGDVDEDGDHDAVLATWKDPLVPLPNLVWINDGRGRFSDASSKRLPAFRDHATALALADLDEDGDLDLVFGVNGTVATRRNRVLLNLHRHVAATVPPRRGKVWRVSFWAAPGYGSGARAVIPMLAAAPREPRLDVRPFGLLGLDPATLSLGAPLPIGGGGSAVLSAAVPNDPRLSGVGLWLQGIVTSKAGVRLTNVLATRIR